MGIFNHGSPSTDIDNDGVPRGLDKEGWKMAELAVLSRVGGWAGVSEAGKRAQIQEAYDQLVENNRQAAAWEGKDEEGM